MTFRIITRGAPRPVTHDFCCPLHGHFEALVDPDADTAPCSVPYECESCGGTPDRHGDVDHDDMCESYERRLPCNLSSPWSPTKAPPMRMRRVEAVRGNHDKAEHKGWCDTSNLEEGQPFDDWQSDRDAVAEELRKEHVMEAIRSDR